MAHHLKTVMMFSVLLMFVISEVCARPRRNQKEEYKYSSHNDKQCSEDPDVVEICQRCAKQTKSPIVYPMCCQNEDDVFNWCNQYINFGRKP